MATLLMTALMEADAPRVRLSDDLLSRRQFCEAIASILMESEGAQCRVVSLEGDWGEGKTSAINMVTDLIGMRDADLRPFLIRLNPWQIGGKDDLVQALLREFAAFVPYEKGTQRAWVSSKLATRLLEYSKLLTPFRLEPVGLVAGAISNGLLKLATLFGSGRYFNLEKRKERINEAIEASKRAIVVIIDDVDRLLPTESVELVRFVRAVADFKRTTYLLSYEHERVVEALDKGGVASPSKFLEKIVQVRTHLPPISPVSIRSFLLQRISASRLYQDRRIFNDSRLRESELLDGAITSLLTNLRLVNRVVAKLELTPTSMSRDVEFWDLLGLSVIAVVGPSVFSLVRSNPALFARQADSKVEVQEKHAEQVSVLFEKAVRDCDHRTRTYLKILTSRIFPNAFGSYSNSLQWQEQNGRACSPKILEAALASAFDQSAISLDVSTGMLTEPNRRSELIAPYLHDEERFEMLCQAMRDQIVVGKTQVIEAGDLIGKMASAWTEFSAAARSSEEDRINIDRVGYISSLIEECIGSAEDFPAAMKVLVDVAKGTLLPPWVWRELLTSPDRASLIVLKSLPEELRRKITAEVFAGFESSLSKSIDDISDFDSNLLFALRHIDLKMFNERTSILAQTSYGRRLLLAALGIGIYSSDVGGVAVWTNDFKSSLTYVDALKKEAEEVLGEAGVQSKRLLASAKALVEGGEVVVSTGMPRKWGRSR